MNLTWIVDQNHSYKQAIKIAYEKALQEGLVDEQTAQECEWVLSEPEPDYIYHEVKDKDRSQLLEDGCISFRTLSARDLYEHIKLSARRNAAECIAVQMERMWEDLKKEVINMKADRLEEISFSVDEAGEVRPVCNMNDLEVDDEKKLFEILDKRSELKQLAIEYASILAKLVPYTADGLSAEYARYFVIFNP